VWFEQHRRRHHAARAWLKGHSGRVALFVRAHGSGHPVFFFAKTSGGSIRRVNRTRAVYNLSSKATHVAGEGKAVVQLRRYVVTIFHEILEM